MLQMNAWELDSIKKEIRNMTYARLQMLYIDKNNEYNTKCVMLVKIQSHKLDNETIEKECELLQAELHYLAIEIANRLTGVDFHG